MLTCQFLIDKKTSQLNNLMLLMVLNVLQREIAIRRVSYGTFNFKKIFHDLCVCDNMSLFPDIIVPKTDGKTVKHSTNECYPNLLEMLWRLCDLFVELFSTPKNLMKDLLFVFKNWQTNLKNLKNVSIGQSSVPSIPLRASKARIIHSLEKTAVD